MDVVVTGAAGFIGSNLTDAPARDGHDVLAARRPVLGLPRPTSTPSGWHQADVADLDAMTEAFAGREVVFHQAAHRSVVRRVDQPLASDHANTHGTLSVLGRGSRRPASGGSCTPPRRASTARPRSGPRPRPPRRRPGSPYAVSKLAGEHYARVYTELYGLETVSLRYFNVYGPRQRPDSAYAPVIPLFIDLLRRGERPDRPRRRSPDARLHLRRRRRARQRPGGDRARRRLLGAGPQRGRRRRGEPPRHPRRPGRSSASTSSRSTPSPASATSATPAPTSPPCERRSATSRRCRSPTGSAARSTGSPPAGPTPPSA